MKIEAISQMTYQTFWKFNLFHMYKGKGYRIQPIIKIILYCFLLLVFLFIFFSELTLDAGSFFSIPFITLLLFYGIVMLSVVFYFPKKAYKNSIKFFQSPTQYSFYDDHIEVISNNPDYNGTSNINYNVLFKVYETRDTFYLYIDKRRAFIIPKTDITAGTADDLKRLLSCRMETKKYIWCN